MANHSGPESCGMHREVQVEALTGETDRPAIEPRNNYSGMPTLLSEAEGNTVHDVNRKSCTDPARSETLCMLGSLSYGSSEISSVSGIVGPDGAGKVNDRNPAIDAGEKSDTPIVPRKLQNKGDEPAEVMEGRGVTGGNANENPAYRTQSRDKRASMGLEGVREHASHDPQTQRCMAVCGVGRITASAVVATVVNARQFRNGRQMAAWIGLVPEQNSSGGKQRLGRITKQGSEYLRTLLFQGARSAILTAHRRDDRLSRWIVQLHARIGYYKTLVAVANKHARILWAVLARDQRFDPSHAPARDAMAAAHA